MVTTPPPSRYKIVEKAGRLITIDTWADAKSITDFPPRIEPTDPRKPMPSLARTAPEIDLALKIANLMTRGEKDERGNFILRTKKFFDEDAPRAFRLTTEQARELGGVGLLLVVAIAILLIIAVVTDFFFVLVIAVVLVSRLSPAFLKPLMKPLLAKAELIE
jgi:hypothetical protein